MFESQGKILSGRIWPKQVQPEQMIECPDGETRRVLGVQYSYLDRRYHFELSGAPPWAVNRGQRVQVD